MPVRLFPFPVLLLIVIAVVISLATVSVNDTSDSLVAGDGKCTLREAIINANTDSDTTSGDCAAGSGADVIDLPMGTYTLSVTGSGEDASFTGDLDITDDLTITGAGWATTIIDGGGIDRVFHILSGATTEISGVTIRNGLFTFSGGVIVGGGGIFNSGALSLNDSLNSFACFG